MASNRPECVAFANNVPEKVALKFPDGILKDFGYGLRMFYTLTDGRAMFLDPDVGQKINMLDVAPGQPFWICKRRGAGKHAATRWDVYLEDPNPVVATSSSPIERDLRLSLQEAPQLRRQAQRAIEAAPPRLDPPPPPPEAVVRKRPGWAESLLAQTNDLTDVYADALAHASQHGISVKPEDVRTMLVTCFINLSQRGGSRNAA